MRHILGRDYLYRKPYLALMQSLVDAPGYLLFRLRKKPPSQVNKILVSRIDHLGDVFIASAVLPHLKKALPKAKIHFLAGEWAWGLLRSNSDLSRVLTYNSAKLNRSGGRLRNTLKASLDFIRNVWEMRSERYDLSIDLRAYPSNSIPLLFFGGCGYRVGFATGGWGFLLNRQVPYREGVHETEHLADALRTIGIDAAGKDLKPEFTLTKTANKESSRILEGLGVANAEPFVLIHTGTGSPAKQWKRDEWQKLVTTLAKGYGVKVVAYDTVYNDLKDCIKLPALISMDLFASAARKASVFIGLDSLPAHVAASFSTPTVVVWCGINDPAQWRPVGPCVSVVRRDAACSPCSIKDGCASMECMDIEAEAVAREAARFLDIQRAPNVIPFSQAALGRKKTAGRRGKWRGRRQNDL